MRIDALGPSGAYQTRNREVVTTTAGAAVVELSIVPPLYVSRTISAQRNTRPLPAEQREAALAKAADAFATGVIAGLDFDTYVDAGQPDIRGPDRGDAFERTRRRRCCRFGIRRSAAGPTRGRCPGLARRAHPRRCCGLGTAG